MAAKHTCWTSKRRRLIVEFTILDEEKGLIAMGQGVDLIIPVQEWVEEGRRPKSEEQIMNT